MSHKTTAIFAGHSHHLQLEHIYGIDLFNEWSTLHTYYHFSSRTYNNKIRNAHGTVHFDNVRYLLPKEFQYDNFPELKGRVTVQIQAAEFNDEGKITDWSVRIYSGEENLTEAQKERVIAEVKRVLELYDFQTFMRDGSWYWRTTRNTPISWPLIFK